MKYEYKILTEKHTDGETTESDLNKLGSKGYELIGVYGNNWSRKFYFKREINDKTGSKTGDKKED